MFNHVGRGRMTTVNTTDSAGPAVSHTSQPDLTVTYKVSEKTRSFCTVIL